jgi:integrase
VKGTVRQVPIKRSITPSGKTRISGGQWYWQATLHAGPGGQVTRRGHRTRKDAQHDMNEFLAAHGRGETRRALVQPSTQPLGDYLAGWLAARAPSLKPSTASSYTMVVRCWIVPILGDCPLRDLSGDRIQRWHAQLRQGVGGRPLSPRSVQYANRVLAMALSDAREAGKLAVDPMTEIPKRQRPQHKPVRRDDMAWDLDQARTFLAAVAEDRLQPLWSLALAIGARRGELLALRWADVDLDAAVNTIARTRAVVDGQTIENVVKNGKPRTVDLDPATVASLRRWRARQAAERLRAGEAYAADDHVFVDEVGSPYNPNTIASRFLARVAKVDVPAISFHGLRHTHCSIALVDTPPHVVASRTGHTVEVLMSVYAHVLKDSGKDAAARFGDRLFGTATS